MAGGIGLKLATLGILGHEEVDKTIDVIKESIKSEENWLKEKINNYMNKTEVIGNFKKALEKVSGKIKDETARLW